MEPTVTEPASSPETLRDTVRARYAAAAAHVQTDGCCGPRCDPRPITHNLYAIDEVADLPSAAVLASLGCRNPTALAELKPGETVLDLGSGGGIDVLLSAK